jgi:hypothetical protein
VRKFFGDLECLLDGVLVLTHRPVRCVDFPSPSDRKFVPQRAGYQLVPRSGAPSTNFAVGRFKQISRQ